MTTVAYKDGIMAADTEAAWNGIRSKAKKISRINGALLGASGNASDILAFHDWWRDGRPDKGPRFRQYPGGDDAPAFSIIVAERGRPAYVWDQYLQPILIEEPFWAVGSGAAAALGALHMGASVAEAVRVAIKVDSHSGGDIQVATL